MLIFTNINIKITPSNKTSSYGDPSSSKLHTSILIYFQAPQAIRPSLNIRDYIELQFKWEKETLTIGSRVFLLWRESGTGCSRSLGHMLSGRFWMCVLSLGLAFIGSPVTGWSAKWVPMWAHSSSRPTLWLAAREEHMHVLLCTLKCSPTWNKTHASVERQQSPSTVYVVKGV